MPGDCRDNGNVEINGLRAGIRDLAHKVPDSFLSIQSPAQASCHGNGESRRSRGMLTNGEDNNKQTGKNSLVYREENLGNCKI